MVFLIFPIFLRKGGVSSESLLPQLPENTVISAFKFGMCTEQASAILLDWYKRGMIA